MPFATRNGVRIYYEERGAGPVLLLLHGAGGGWRAWEPQLEGLSDAFRVVAWDARGYGNSDVPAAPITQHDFALDAGALLDHLRAPQAHICGLSMGGMTAQQLYELFPERVRSLVLAATMPGFGSLPNSQALLDKSLAALTDEGFRANARKRATLLLGNSPDPTLVETLTARMQAIKPETYRQAFASMYAVDFFPLLPTITVPTLIISGREDRVIPPKHAEDLHRRIPGSQLALIDGAGHVCNLERAEEFNRLVRQFVLDVESTPLTPPG